jgi:hypothetical protein
MKAIIHAGCFKGESFFLQNDISLYLDNNIKKKVYFPYIKTNTEYTAIEITQNGNIFSFDIIDSRFLKKECKIFYRIARVRDKNFSNIKTGHIHIANPKEDAYIPDLLKITIRLFDREEIIEEIKKMLERCFTK